MWGKGPSAYNTELKHLKNETSDAEIEGSQTPRKDHHRVKFLATVRSFLTESETSQPWNGRSADREQKRGWSHVGLSDQGLGLADECTVKFQEVPPYISTLLMHSRTIISGASTIIPMLRLLLVNRG